MSEIFLMMIKNVIFIFGVDISMRWKLSHNYDIKK